MRGIGKAPLSEVTMLAGGSQSSLNPLHYTAHSLPLHSLNPLTQPIVSTVQCCLHPLGSAQSSKPNILQLDAT